MSVTTLKIQCNRGGTDFWLPYWSRNTCNNKNVCPVKILQENFEHCANGINTILFSLMCLTRKFTSPSYFPVLMYTCFIKTWAPLISFQYFFPKIKKRTKHLPSLFWKKKNNSCLLSFVEVSQTCNFPGGAILLWPMYKTSLILKNLEKCIITQTLLLVRSQPFTRE